jgi:hypothetical protein
VQFNRFEEGCIAHRSWTGKDKHIERLRCTVCGCEFSERVGTLMARSKLPEATVERLLKCQRWGVCDEGTADICAVDLKTVHREAHTVVMQSVVASVMALLPVQIWYNNDGISGRAFTFYVETFFLPSGASCDGLHCAHF